MAAVTRALAMATATCPMVTLTRVAFTLTTVSRQSSRHVNGADCRMASSISPVRHQNATSHDGASRPRKERSSTRRLAWQQMSLTAITGAGQNTERASSVRNAAEAMRRLASIDIKPFPDHAQRVDSTVSDQRWSDLDRVDPTGDDDSRMHGAEGLGIDVTH